MNILHVIHSIDPRSGGPSHVIRNMICQQVGAGHRVSLLTTTAQAIEPWAPDGDYLDRVLNDRAFAGAEVFAGKGYGRHRPWSRYSYSPECRRWLGKQGLGPSGPDIMHIHGSFSHLTAGAAIWARRSCTPYIVRPAGILDPRALHGSRRLLKQLFLKCFLERALRGATYVHAASEAEGMDAKRWVPDNRVRVIPHGVAIPPAGTIAKEAFLARFPQVRSRSIVLCMARIHPVKQLDLLVQAVASLRKSRSHLVLLIAGHDAGHLAVLQSTVQKCGMTDAFVHTGFLEGLLKQGAFAVADVFVLPSKHENFGMAAVEAMAHAVPVVVTSGVACRDHIELSGAGRIADSGVDAIATALDQVLQNDPVEMGKRGFEYVKRQLSSDAMAFRIEEMYEDAVRAAAVSCTEQTR